MRLRLTANGVELSAELKEYVVRHAHFGLGRFAGRINGLSVRLASHPGTTTGPDKCCDIRVDAGLSRAVVVRERQPNIHAAVAIAMERAERAIRRQLAIS